MQEQIIGLLNPVITLAYAAGFFLLWLRDRSLRASLALAVANLSVAFAFMSSFFFSTAYSFPDILLPQFLFLASGVLIAWASCERVGQGAPLKAMVAIAAGMLLLIGMAAEGGHFLSMLYLINLGHALNFTLAAFVLSRAAPRHFLDRVILWLMVALAAQFILRPALAIMLEPNLNPATFGQSAYYAVLIVTMAFSQMLLSTSFIAAFMLDQFRSREAQTRVDALTGLKLRSSFEEEAVELLDRASQQNVPVGMIVADIDLFKQVNDIFGHQAGDKVIATFGKLCGNMVRNSDLSGRIGGEEFCLIAWHCDEATIHGLAERIRVAFAKTEHSGISSDIRLTASFGVASWRDGEGYGKLFARADAALYRAKREGRNRVVTDRCPTEIFEQDSGAVTAAAFADRRKAGHA